MLGQRLDFGTVMLEFASHRQNSVVTLLSDRDEMSGLPAKMGKRQKSLSSSDVEIALIWQTLCASEIFKPATLTSPLRSSSDNLEKIDSLSLEGRCQESRVVSRFP
jgi:hypothetical protein